MKPYLARVRYATHSVVVAVINSLVLESVIYSAPPLWWRDRAAIDSAKAADDYAAANAGQLKHIAVRAIAELDQQLPGGAGETLLNTAAAWANSSSDNFVGVTVGQLKFVGAQVYNRLRGAGLSIDNPWSATLADDNDLALVNLGQLKRVFDFDLTTYDHDGDSMADVWELRSFGNLSKLASGDDDADGSDGLTNLQEYQRGGDPTRCDTDGDGLLDSSELVYGRDINWRDHPLVQLTAFGVVAP